MISIKTISNLRSLALFFVTLVLANWQTWTAADVAWSMWVASLIGGYTIMVMMALTAKVPKDVELGPEIPIAARLFVGLFLLLFLLLSGAFLVFHFTGFHLGHAVFFSVLLPPSQVDAVLMQTPLLFAQQLIAAYWPFSIVVIIHTVFTMRENPKDMNVMTPYISVVKNHFLIFILAFLQAVKTPTLILYVLLFYYFFPVRDSYALLRSTAARLLGR